MCCREGEFLACGGGEGERALLQAAEVEGEAVAHPGQDFEFVAAAVLEDEEVARCGIAAKDSADNAGETIDPLASILGLDGHVDGAGGADG